MDFLKDRPIVSVLAAFIIGFFVGLVIFGWWLTPVQWKDAGPQDLLLQSQESYVRTAADLYAFDNNEARVQRAFSVWPDGAAKACQMAVDSGDPADATRLITLATVINGSGCDQYSLSTSDTDQARGNDLLVIFGLAFLLLLILGAIYMVWQRQGQPVDTASRRRDVSDMEELGPALEGDSEVETTPVARFRTTYKLGHDTYDDSFSIENASGEFLGECGVGISESIGVDAPKSVTAFEVWLFDKNDIRTVTKVIMSDHAFFDEALKAKLAPKGEPVLAREGETVVLETASLIINARVAELIYGDSPNLPAQSFFENFTVELSAWAKEGDFGDPDISGRVDELMNY